MTNIIFTLLHNLLDFQQVNLFKTAKHWDRFFTHCIPISMPVDMGFNDIIISLRYITYL